MFECLQSRKIVLVNTAMSILGSEGSQLLGRYMIALTLNAAFERVSVPKEQWNPAYLIIDEFHEFADEQKTPELLRLAREYNLGCTIAHQQMHGQPMTDSLRNSISTNTSIKYAAGVEGQDLAYVARDLRCDPEFIKRQKRTDAHAHFACFVRNFTDHPISVSVPLGNINEGMSMAKAAYQELLRRNAAALSTPIAEFSTPPVPSFGSSLVSHETQSTLDPEPKYPQSSSDTPEAGSTW